LHRRVAVEELGRRREVRTSGVLPIEATRVEIGGGGGRGGGREVRGVFEEGGEKRVLVQDPMLHSCTGNGVMCVKGRVTESAKK